MDWRRRFSFLSRRRCQRLFDRPSALETSVNRLSTDSRFIAPFSRCHRFSAKRQESSVSIVSVLLDRRRPFAILWTIVSVIVDSIDRMLVAWTPSHVFEKGFIPRPAFTNTDASRAIVFEGAMVFVIATAEHCRPCAVFCGLFPVASLPVSDTRLSSPDAIFAPETTTRLGFANSQQLKPFRRRLSAITKTVDKTVTVVLENLQSSVLFHGSLVARH